MKNKFGVIALSVALLLTASMAFAQESAGPESVSDLVQLIEDIAVWFQMIVLIIAVIMIIWAGLTWMTAGGDDEKLTKARRMFIWGLVGIAVVLFAYVAVNFVTDLLGGGT